VKHVETNVAVKACFGLVRDTHNFRLGELMGVYSKMA
jgi:hypothetical protein